MEPTFRQQWERMADFIKNNPPQAVWYDHTKLWRVSYFPEKGMAYLHVWRQTWRQVGEDKWRGDLTPAEARQRAYKWLGI